MRPRCHRAHPEKQTNEACVEWQRKTRFSLSRSVTAPEHCAPFRRLSAVVYYVGWKRHLQFTDHCCFRHELRKNMQTIASGSHVGRAQKGAIATLARSAAKNNTLSSHRGRCAHASWWRFVSILSSALSRFVMWYVIYWTWYAKPKRIKYSHTFKRGIWCCFANLFIFKYIITYGYGFWSPRNTNIHTLLLLQQSFKIIWHSFLVSNIPAEVDKGVPRSCHCSFANLVCLCIAFSNCFCTRLPLIGFARANFSKVFFY